jgi:hypothetical protein
MQPLQPSGSDAMPDGTLAQSQLFKLGQGHRAVGPPRQAPNSSIRSPKLTFRSQYGRKLSFAGSRLGAGRLGLCHSASVAESDARWRREGYGRAMGG